MLLLMTLQNQDLSLLPEILTRIKVLLNGDKKIQNIQFIIEECPESLGLLCLLLLLSAGKKDLKDGESKVYQEINQLSLTILLGMSF